MNPITSQGCVASADEFRQLAGREGAVKTPSRPQHRLLLLTSGKCPKFPDHYFDEFGNLDMSNFRLVSKGSLRDL